MAQRLKIPGVLQTRAAFEPATFDEKAGTVEVVFTTGARGKRRSWSGPYFEELEVSEKAVDLSRLNNGASVLNAHSSWDLRDVIGVVERAWIAGKEGRALVRFSDREDVQPIVRDVKNGILRHVSVGYSVERLEQVEKIDDVPVYRATRWTPAELSLVPIAFDDGAVVRGRPEPEFHEVEVLSTAEEKRTMPDTIPAATPAIPTDAAAAAEATRAAEERGAQAERARVTGIRQAVRAAKLGDQVADQLVKDGTTVDAARAQILERLAAADDKVPTDQHVRVELGDDEADKFARAAQAWIFARAGVTSVIRDAKKARPDHPAFADVELDPGDIGVRSMFDLAEKTLVRAGVRNTARLNKMDLVGRAFLFRAHGFNTTSDFANILENALHKLLLAAYGVTPDSWSAFCARGSVSDFRPHPRYRLGSFGRLDKLTEHGEFKNKSIPDAEKQSITADTRGNIIGLDRQSIINDDMGAFARLATMLGRAAKLSIEMDAYDALALNSGLGPLVSDGKSLFHADHKNVGTGAAISAAAIYADRVVLASQKDPAGNEILDLRPDVLLLPIGLGGDARVINEAQYDPDTANKLQRPNASRGFFRTIVDTARLTGTRRYLFADPNVAPVLEVAFLDGQSEPFLDVMNGWRIDGVEWKVRLDYGVGAVDFRGAVTNAGQ